MTADIWNQVQICINRIWISSLLFVYFSSNTKSFFLFHSNQKNHLYQDPFISIRSADKVFTLNRQYHFN